MKDGIVKIYIGGESTPLHRGGDGGGLAIGRGARAGGGGRVRQDRRALERQPYGHFDRGAPLAPRRPEGRRRRPARRRCDGGALGRGDGLGAVDRKSVV